MNQLAHIRDILREYSRLDNYSEGNGVLHRLYATTVNICLSTRVDVSAALLSLTAQELHASSAPRARTAIVFVNLYRCIAVASMSRTGHDALSGLHTVEVVLGSSSIEWPKGFRCPAGLEGLLQVPAVEHKHLFDVATFSYAHKLRAAETGRMDGSHRPYAEVLSQVKRAAPAHALAASETLANHILSLMKQYGPGALAAGDHRGIWESVGHLASCSEDYGTATMFFDMAGPSCLACAASCLLSTGRLTEAAELAISCAKALDVAAVDMQTEGAVVTDAIRLVVPVSAAHGAYLDEDEMTATFAASEVHRVACYVVGSSIAAYFSSYPYFPVTREKTEHAVYSALHIQSGASTLSVTVPSPLSLRTCLSGSSLSGRDTDAIAVDVRGWYPTLPGLAVWTPSLALHLLLRAAGVGFATAGGARTVPAIMDTEFGRECLAKVGHLAATCLARGISLDTDPGSTDGREGSRHMVVFTTGSRLVARALGSAQDTCSSLPADWLPPGSASDSRLQPFAPTTGPRPHAFISWEAARQAMSQVLRVLQHVQVPPSLRAACLEAMGRASAACAVAAVQMCHRSGLNGSLAALRYISGPDGQDAGAHAARAALMAACAAAAAAVEESLSEGIRLHVDGKDVSAVTSPDAAGDDTKNARTRTGRYVRRTPNPWIPARIKVLAAVARTCRAAAAIMRTDQGGKGPSRPLPPEVVSSLRKMPPSTLSPPPPRSGDMQPSTLQAALTAVLTDYPALGAIALRGGCGDGSIRALVRKLQHGVDARAEQAIHATLAHAAHVSALSGQGPTHGGPTLVYAVHCEDEMEGGSPEWVQVGDGDSGLLGALCCLLDATRVAASYAQGQGEGQDSASFWAECAASVLGPGSRSHAPPSPMRTAVTCSLSLAIGCAWTLHVRDSAAALFASRLMTGMGLKSSTASTAASQAYAYASSSVVCFTSARILTLLAVFTPANQGENRGREEELTGVPQQLAVAAAELLAKEALQAPAVAARPLLLCLPQSMDALLPARAREALGPAREAASVARALRVEDASALLPTLLPAGDAAHVPDPSASGALQAGLPFSMDRSMLPDPVPTALPLLFRDAGFRDFARAFLLLLCTGVLYTPPAISSLSSQRAAINTVSPRYVDVDGLPLGIEQPGGKGGGAARSVPVRPSRRGTPAPTSTTPPTPLPLRARISLFQGVGQGEDARVLIKAANQTQPNEEEEENGDNDYGFAPLRASLSLHQLIGPHSNPPDPALSHVQAANAGLSFFGSEPDTSVGAALERLASPRKPFNVHDVPADVAFAAASQLLSAHGLRLLVAAPTAHASSGADEGGTEYGASLRLAPLLANTAPVTRGGHGDSRPSDLFGPLVVANAEAVLVAEQKEEGPVLSVLDSSPGKRAQGGTSGRWGRTSPMRTEDSTVNTSRARSGSSAPGRANITSDEVSLALDTAASAVEPAQPFMPPHPTVQQLVEGVRVTVQASAASLGRARQAVHTHGSGHGEHERLPALPDPASDASVGLNGTVMLAVHPTPSVHGRGGGLTLGGAHHAAVVGDIGPEMGAALVAEARMRQATAISSARQAYVHVPALPPQYKQGVWGSMEGGMPQDAPVPRIATLSPLNYAGVGGELARVKAQMSILAAHTDHLAHSADRIADEFLENDSAEAHAEMEYAMARRGAALRSMRERTDVLLAQTTRDIAGGPDMSSVGAFGGPLTAKELKELSEVVGSPARYTGKR